MSDNMPDFMVLIAKHDAAFVGRVLAHFIEWGLHSMDRELARQALEHLTLISPDGEVLKTEELLDQIKAIRPGE